MRVLDKLKRRRLLLSFEIAIGEENEVEVQTAPAEPELDTLELIRFWAFAAGRILYELWFNNTYLALPSLSTA